jgi:hypothetical protein
MSADPLAATPRNEERLLVRAGELVTDGWSRHSLAEDRDGRSVAPWSPSARRWSPLGALLRASYESGEDGADELQAAYRALARAAGGAVSTWNTFPGRTHDDVRDVFTRAREYLSDAGESSAGAAPKPTVRRAL